MIEINEGNFLVIQPKNGNPERGHRYQELFKSLLYLVILPEDLCSRSSKGARSRRRRFLRAKHGYFSLDYEGEDDEHTRKEAHVSSSIETIGSGKGKEQLDIETHDTLSSDLPGSLSSTKEEECSQLLSTLMSLSECCIVMCPYLSCSGGNDCLNRQFRDGTIPLDIFLEFPTEHVLPAPIRPQEDMMADVQPLPPALQQPLALCKSCTLNAAISKDHSADPGTNATPEIFVDNLSQSTACTSSLSEDEQGDPEENSSVYKTHASEGEPHGTATFDYLSISTGTLSEDKELVQLWKDHLNRQKRVQNFCSSKRSLGPNIKALVEKFEPLSSS